MFLIKDELIKLKSKIDDTTGFLTSRVRLSRVGVQYYLGAELGLADRATEKIGVLRPAEEVFHPDSVNSFINLVATDQHPTVPITIDNVKKLQVGSVSHVEKADTTLDGIITITSKDEIEKIKAGRDQVSVGYSNDLVPKIGIFNGDKYEFVQTNIRANHLAIVDAGRCGGACKIILSDQNKENVMIILIDGIEFDTKNAQLVQAVNKLIKSHDAEVSELEKKLQKEKDEKEEEKKKASEMEAKKDAAEKEKTSDADISALVSKRAKLLSEGKLILGDAMPECVDCDDEIKTLVVETLIPDMELKDKPEAYLDAAYDMAVKKFEKGNASTKKLQDDFRDKKVITADRADARNKYMKDQLKLGEV